MRKTLLASLFFVGIACTGYAQINSGGLPLSFTTLESIAADQYAATVHFKAPDMSEILKGDQEATRSDPKPYRAGVLVATDFSFPESGSIIILSDGRKIWRGQMSLGNVPALMLYYDQFKLPKGAKLFITNANKKQILGAYTENNNSEDGLFASQAVQGGLVNLELDIDPSVNTDDIKLHINKAAVMYRAVSYLNKYAGESNGGTVMKPTIEDPIFGYSSVCEINAICPEGQNYPDQRKATVRIIMPMGGGYVGFCTGTLINNTKGDCTPYILTATHCEPDNSTSDSTYAQWVFFFNFETPDCAGTQEAPNDNVLQGATFMSRAAYNSTSNVINGDFLLVKLKDKVPAAFDAYFAGWNRSATMPSPSTYINFHHPSGDSKKLAVSNNISPNGAFNQAGSVQTHWAVNYSVGGNEEGSSGSGLFDVNGRLIGDLSGGSETQACDADTNSFGAEAIMGQDAVFSKLSRNWEYPEGNGVATARLKPWLDPSGSGAMVTNSLAAANSCDVPVTGITNRNANLDDYISVYPNPVVNGTLRIRVNLDKTSDLTVTVYDINGARKANYSLSSVRSGDYAFDMSGYANGAYMIAVSNGDASTTKKVMLTH